MCENVFSKGSETIFSNKAFRMLTGLRHYKLLDTEMGDRLNQQLTDRIDISDRRMYS